MKKALFLGFLLMGFSFTVTQVLLMASFGNALSIGLILGWPNAGGSGRSPSPPRRSCSRCSSPCASVPPM
jgi:hypothetical protein